MKASIKQLRGVTVINAVATSVARAILRAARTRSAPVERHLPRVGISASRLPNGRMLRMWSKADDQVANRLYWRGWQGYEPDLAPLFCDLATRSRLTLDIGAHTGFYTLLAAHANPRGQVFGFEPYPPVFARLERNVRVNAVLNAIPVRTAVGVASGRADLFYVPGVGMPSSSGLSLDFMQSVDSSLAQLAVTTVTIDDFVRDRHLANVDLVKIDTESTESDVIGGMLETIGHSHPNIFCEILPEAHNLTESDDLPEVARLPVPSTRT